jgi:hypothetical protein
MNHLGPLLAQSLVQNVGGNASRSELDKLSDPLKKLVTQQPRAQAWLEQALLDERFPSAHVSRQDKLLFLKKIVRSVSHVQPHIAASVDADHDNLQPQRCPWDEPGGEGLLAYLPGFQLCVRVVELRPG